LTAGAFGYVAHVGAGDTDIPDSETDRAAESGARQDDPVELDIGANREPSSKDVVDVTASLFERDVDQVRADEHGRNATNPFRITFAGWKDIAVRVKDEWGDDHVGIAAAAVAFYSFLALIPALAAVVSILGLVAQGDDPARVIDDLFGALPADARDVLVTQLDEISGQSSGTLSFGLVLGLVLSIWSASGAVGQLINTINIAYDEDETRSWQARKGVSLLLTFGATVYVAIAVFMVTALPAIIDASPLGVGTRRLLGVLIWPGLALTFLVALALLYRFAPDRSPARWRWVSVGSVFAVLGWIVVTLGFRLYVVWFGSYNETYGSLAGAVVALLWLWLTAVVVLLGAEINAEMEHQTARDTTVGGDQPMGSRGAIKADTLGELRD
jgi:membrane protein